MSPVWFFEIGRQRRFVEIHGDDVDAVSVTGAGSWFVYYSMYSISVLQGVSIPIFMIGLCMAYT